MPAIGITGGVSTGKSTFCDCFGEILPAARFFDDDRVAHTLVDVPGIKKELVREWREIFFRRGADYADSNGWPEKDSILIRVICGIRGYRTTKTAPAR